MGNARFLIVRSSSTLEGYRTSLKLMKLGKEYGFEEKKFTRVVVYNGTKRWYLGNKNVHHRLDGPAIEYENGDKIWFIDGKLHRVDGPAVEWDGDKIWFFKGKKHRECGPAVECADGYKEWWRNGCCLSFHN